MLQCYYEPLKAEAAQGKHFSVEKLNQLFGNLPDVYTFHAALALQLQDRVEDRWDAERTCIGDIFVRSVRARACVYMIISVTV